MSSYPPALVYIKAQLPYLNFQGRVKWIYRCLLHYISVPQSDHRDVLFRPCTVLHYISIAQLDHRDVLLDYVSLFYTTLKEDEDVFSYELRKFTR